jgi:drug/metabolite transporter (DMT)-like permease
MQNRKAVAVLFICSGVLIFSLQDAIIKLMSGQYPVSEAVYIRSLIAIPLLVFFVHMETGLGSIAAPQFGWLLVRGATLLISYTAYYLAFPALPLAEAVALSFTIPLFITALARPILGEIVTGRSWAAICTGFVGVLVILRPGAAIFEPAALFSLLSAFLYGLSAIMTRQLGISVCASVMALYQNVVFLVGAACFALVVHAIGPYNAIHPSIEFLIRPWSWPTTYDMLLLASCGVIAAIGTILLTNAYKIAEANFVSSFEYTGILWAPLWGLLLFKEVPHWTTVLGALLIITSGLVALRKGDYTKPPQSDEIAPNRPTVVATDKLLDTLRYIAVRKSDKNTIVDIHHVEQLSDLGYIMGVGSGKYAVTMEGEAVLKKARQRG